MRVLFEADGDDDWDAMTPPVPERPIFPVTLVATDPDGLSASVQGSFAILWEPSPTARRRRRRWSRGPCPKTKATCAR